MEDLQPITSATNIIGALSPYYVIAKDSTINWNSIELRLWVWQGELEDATPLPTQILKKSKLMQTDSSLEFELSDYLIDAIEPMINPFNFQAVFGVSATFFYYEVDYLNTSGSTSTLLKTVKSPLKLATLGWRYSYELNTDESQYVNGGYMANGWYLSQFSDNNQFYKNSVEYSDKMANYLFSFKKNFPISDSNEAFLITPFEPSIEKIACTKDSYGIAFINKTGVWDTLPFTGKTQEVINTTSDTYNRGYRSNFNYNPQYQNSQMQINQTEKTTFTLNTGHISEQLSAYYEELMYSPRLILVDYDKLVSYPVKVKSSSFTRKNKNVDKNKINHTFSFESDNNNMKKW